MKESGLRLKKKLQSKAGETIAETLVTMIILSRRTIQIPLSRQDKQEQR